MDFQHSKSAVVHIIEEENRGVTEENRDTHIQVSHQNDNFTNPFSINDFQTHREGTRNDPISLEEEVQILGETGENRGKQGIDQNHPILVEDYYYGEDFDDILLQIAIEESLCVLSSPDIIELDPDDLKGKKPQKEPPLKSVLEIGQSSNPAPIEPEVDCSICMEPKFHYECFKIKNCSHFYCSSCVSQYVEAKIEENVTSIRCPDPSCKDGSLEPEMCRLILKPEVFDRWGSALCEAMIIGSMRFYCPYEDCSALLIDEGGGGEVIRESECPHCYRLFCAQCRVPWHSKVSCEDFGKLSADERGREDLMLKEMAKSCQWQRCPMCKFYVERISGCMFMKCRCGHQFCYGCATTMTQDHYCQKCKR